MMTDLIMVDDVPGLGNIYRKDTGCRHRRAAWIARCRNASTTAYPLRDRCAKLPRMPSAWQSSPPKT